MEQGRIMVLVYEGILGGDGGRLFFNQPPAPNIPLSYA